MTSPVQIITMSRHDSPADSFSGHEPAPSDDGSWHYMDIPSAPSDASSVVLQGSPVSGSLASYGVIIHRGQGLAQSHRGPSHSPAMNQSPAMNMNHSPEALPLQLPPTSSPSQLVDRQPSSFSSSSYMTGQMPLSLADLSNMAASNFSSNQFTANASEPSADDFQHQMMRETLLMGMNGEYNGLQGFYSDGLAPANVVQPALQTVNTVNQTHQTHQTQQHIQSSPPQNSYISQARSNSNVSAWDPSAITVPQQAQVFAMDGFGLGSLSPASSYASVSGGAHSMSHASASPRSPPQPQVETENPAPELQLTPLQQLQLEQLQQEMLQFQQTQQQQQQQFLQQQQQRQQQQNAQLQQQQQQQQQQQLQAQFPLTLDTQVSVPLNVHDFAITTPTEQKYIPHDLMSKPIPTRSAPTSINKVRGPSTRVTKKKTSPSSSLQLSGSHGSSSGSSSGEDKFVIFTPKTISTHAGNGSRFNPFECFEAMSATQKGRKGPLAEEVKESALQVRRAGACFCCHSRKVKCDAQLPCKNCIKLATHMPQAICWRFDDFLGPLFPSIIRAHFEKAQMAQFVAENVGAYSPAGLFTINLASGPAFKTSLEIRNVKFFSPTPRAIVLQHTRLTTGGGRAHLSSENSIPLGLDLSESSAISASLQADKIKKALRAYVEGILKEEAYVDTMTANVTQTEVPRKVLAMVHAFWLSTSAPIVKQALYIYTLQYLMMHHLTLTSQTLQNLPLSSLGISLSDTPFQTARLLQRQIKAICDEVMQEDVDKLFRMFARELKPKARTAWATCLAAFLVFCLFMEMTGTSLDYFVVAENEAKLQNCERLNPRHKRAAAITLSRELENLPFRQFALQFHNIYQTHQTAASTTSPTSASPTSAIKTAFNPLLDDGPLQSGDLDKHAAAFVRQLRTLIDGDSWHELDFLSYSDMLDTDESFPMPRDVAMDYTGRLCSKFLLSFQRESYIYTPA